jgi:hypothetical protein
LYYTGIDVIKEETSEEDFYRMGAALEFVIEKTNTDKNGKPI